METIILPPSSGGSNVSSVLFPSPTLLDGIASTSWTTASPSAAALPHSVGVWEQFLASTSEDSDVLTIVFSGGTGQSTSDSSTIVDVGVGAPGEEVVWASFLYGYAYWSQILQIPGHIPAGSRLSFRTQSVLASRTAIFHAYLHPSNVSPLFGTPRTYGLDRANSRGVLLSTPAAINTDGPWTELVLATDVALKTLALRTQGGSTNIMSGGTILIDIGVGPEGAEVPIIEKLSFFASSQESFTDRHPSTYGVDVPAGSRIAARYFTSNLTNLVDLSVIGTPAA